MLTLLNPAALIGLVLLGIPVLLHIFKPRKVRQVPFSSLRWLRASQHRMTRRVQWHQVLLFLVRAAFILLLVLALSRPTLLVGGASSRADRFVLLDTSGSMSYQTPGRPATIDSGTKVARHLLEHAPAADRSTAVLWSSHAEPMGPLTPDPRTYVTRVGSARAAGAAADLDAALGAVRAMLDSDPADHTVELHVVTDHQRNTWSPGPIARFMQAVQRPVAVRVYDVSADDPQNTWIASAELATADGQRFVEVQVATCAHQAVQRTVRFTGLADLPEATEAVTVAPDSPARVRFRLPANYDTAGKIATLALEPNDELRGDDTYWLSLDEAGSGILVIEPDAPELDELSAGFHLRAALTALSESSGTPVQIVRRTPQTVSGADVAAAGTVMLVDVPKLEAEVASLLDARLASGAGVAVFLGPSADPDFYRNWLKLELKGVQSPGKTGKVAHLTAIEWEHPLLAGVHLGDPVFSDLGSVAVRSYHDLALADDLAHVIATIDNGPPAIAERRVGAGVALIFNTTASDAWSDLPRRRAFVPLVDRVLTQLGGGAVRTTFAMGEPIIAPLPDCQLDSSGLPSGVHLTDPTGRTAPAAARVVAGRAMLWLDAAKAPQEAGVYRVSYPTAAGRTELPLIVQFNRRESSFARVDTGALAAWWAPASVEVVRPLSDPAALRVADRKMDLTPWFVLLACAALLTEMYLVHRLCPAVNPTVARSVLSQRGFFNTTTSGSEPVNPRDMNREHATAHVN